MRRIEGELAAVVCAHARRRYRAEGLRLALALLSPFVLLATLAAVCVVMGILSTSSFALRAVAILLVLAVPAVALAWAFRRIDALGEAKQLDDALGLKDRLTSALSFLALVERTSFQDATVRDAGRYLDRIRTRRETDVHFRKPLLTLLTVTLLAALLFSVAWRLRPQEANVGDEHLLANRGPDVDPSRGGASPSPRTKSPDAQSDDADLEEVTSTTLTEEAENSAFTDAELKELAAMKASEMGEADRLLAQAAYLDESDLSDSGLGKSGETGDDDRVTMKEPDMDMIRQMVKDAQKRKKEGQTDDDGQQIKLEVLIKTHAAASGKRPRQRPGKRSSAGAGGGPSQDTRIKPSRILKKLDTVAFKITSVRSLTPAGATGGKRVALSEAIMRTSGVTQPYLVDTRAVAAPMIAARSTPIFAQAVPDSLRAIVSKYFEGLKQIPRSP